MSLLQRITIICFVILFTREASAACPIENGPSPLLAAYIRETTATLQKISNASSRWGVCRNATNGNFAKEKRFFEILDRVDSQVIVKGGYIQDFWFNILSVFRGESRQVVVRDAEIFRTLEGQIQGTLRASANSCGLEVMVPDLKNNVESAIVGLLARNRRIEDYYKKVAIGNSSLPSGLDATDSALFTEIGANYHRDATSQCTNTAPYESLSASGLQAIAMKGKYNQSSLDEWKKAIDLITGKNSNSREYQALQARLLSAELTRQGVTAGARDIMLKKLSCIQAASSKKADENEIGWAYLSCSTQFQAGGETLISNIKWLIATSTNTEQYVARVLKYEKLRSTVVTNFSDTWAEIELAGKDTSETDAQTLQDLYDLHIKLSTLNTELKKHIPLVQKSCMTGSPDIVGGCR